MSAPMPSHHYQCDYWYDQYPWECSCGLTGPRHPMMDRFPHDRPPTSDESAAAWRALGELDDAARAEKGSGA